MTYLFLGKYLRKQWSINLSYFLQKIIFHSLEKLMWQQFRFLIVFLAILGNLVLVSDAKAAISNDLKITVGGLKKPQGQICFSNLSLQTGYLIFS
ncbi:hypothetical protein [Mastigocoleus sp. MO_188.B34]|uniref:hypothetical protein n=1 Tax=Mastigocoleus sp. MO_188.B34 TaxID=3036635 RepID=UPI0026087763|nr:hypothetical protein [Mastigocoleus sp. MO_188.B34]